MPSTHTTRNRLEKQAVGENDATWGTRLNDRMIDMIDEAMDGYDLTDINGSGTYTLTANNGLTDESRNRYLDLTGTLTGNRDVVVPTQERWWFIRNGTDGAFTVTVKTTAGTGITMEQGKSAILFCDGVNVEYLLPGQGWSSEQAATAAGTDTYTATITPAPLAYFDGMQVDLIFTNANTGAATINLNSLGAKAIQRNGAAIGASEIAATSRVPLSYDGTAFQMAAVKINLADVLDSGTAAAVNTGVGNGDIPVLDATGYPAIDGSQITNLNVVAMDRQAFTASGTWTKPAGVTSCYVEAIGAGGSGGQSSNGHGGGGGAGGAFVNGWFVASDLGATETVTINSGGAAITGAATDGNAGGTSTFGAFLTAYGGGGGAGVSSNYGGGGGGGGALSVGVDATTTTGQIGGEPNVDSTNGASNSGYGGGNGGNGGFAGGVDGGSSANGGGGGGGGTSGTVPGDGGASLRGGGGGGSGADGTVGGTGGVSVLGGNGGAGAFDASNATAGTQPGGGGGGSETGDSGAGADGQIIVISF